MDLIDKVYEIVKKEQWFKPLGLDQKGELCEKVVSVISIDKHLVASATDATVLWIGEELTKG